MKITIFGLGYVGAVTGACLANFGHQICIIDHDRAKVETLLGGTSPIYEPGLQELIKQGITNDSLKSTNNVEEGLFGAEVILVCVGTPTNPQDNSPNLEAITTVANQIADHLLSVTKKKYIAICSTVPPGTTENLFRAILLGRGIGTDKFELAFIPEFLREGSAINDYLNPTRYIIGVKNLDEGNFFKEIRPDLYDRTYVVDVEVAEMLKTVENSWHALKIVFANEVARVSAAYDVDSKEVMNLLSLDNRQNISPAYLRPGFAFGGSCLPKDLRSLDFMARSKNLSTPVISNILESNRHQILNAIELISRCNPQTITILGLAFKANTDDLRESPTLRLLSEISDVGYFIKVHDFNVVESKLIGANKELWDKSKMLFDIFDSDLESAVLNVDLIVIAQYDRRYQDILNSPRFVGKILNLAGL
jgi:GDP-mannose 6-dehydrogenase